MHWFVRGLPAALSMCDAAVGGAGTIAPSVGSASGGGMACCLVQDALWARYLPPAIPANGGPRKLVEC